MNPLISRTLFGSGSSRMASTFFGSCLTPSLLMTNPRYFVSSLQNAHFLSFNLSPWCRILLKIVSMCLRCSSGFFENISTSSSKPCRIFNIFVRQYSSILGRRRACGSTQKASGWIKRVLDDRQRQSFLCYLLQVSLASILTLSPSQ